MDKVIKLLNSEKQHLPNQISHCIDEIEKGREAIKYLQSPEFIELNKDRECWSEDWTIQDYIELNVNANKRSIEAYSKRLAEKKDYLSQIERALKILKEEEKCEPEPEPSCFNCRWCNTYTKWCGFSDESIDGRANICEMWECNPYEKED